MLNIRTQPSLSRDFTLLSVFILFILLLVSAWVAKESIDNYHREVQKEMESEAVRLDRALIVEVENASYILESLGRQIQATGPENQAQIAQLYFSFAKTASEKHSIFSWATKDQMLTVSSNLGVLKDPIDVSDRDYIKKSIAEPWKMHIGRPIDGRLSQKWVLPISLGITDNNGTYVGTVVIALDTQIMTDDVRRTLKDPNIGFAITNLSLSVLTKNPSSNDFFNATFDPQKLQAIDFDSHPSGEYSRGSIFGNDTVYSYYERSSQYPYVIFLGLNSSKTQASLRALLMPRIFQLVVIAVFLLFVLYSVRSRIIHPVMGLTAKTAGIIQGVPFDHSTTTGPLEIEQLSLEIKRLSDFIEERQRVESELRAKNSELNRVKDAAQLTNQVKADFFSFVGHELTEPAEVILEQIETIKDQHFGLLGNPLYVQHAYEVHEHAQQLLAMLGDIKAISEAETGLLALNEGEVDLNFVLQKTLRIFRDKNPSNVEVQVDVNHALPNILGDELRIKQLILNILTAASRHLSSGDTIRITSSIRAQELALIFSYVSGSDLHRNAAARAVIVSNATRSKHGLEMALARLLIAMHQGTLEMKTTQDRTTTVTIKFPAIRVV